MRILINRPNSQKVQSLTDLTPTNLFKLTEADNWAVKVGVIDINQTLNLKKSVSNLNTFSAKIAIGVPGESSLLFTTLSTYTQPVATINASGLGYKVDLKSEDYLSGNVTLITPEGITGSINPRMSSSSIQSAIRKGYINETPAVIDQGNGVFEVISNLALPSLNDDNYQLLDYLSGEFYASEAALVAYYALTKKPNLFAQVVLDNGGTIQETILMQAAALPRTIVGNPTPPPVGQTYLTEVTADALYLRQDNNLSDLDDVNTAKTNLNLDNVDNTSDINKPISTLTQAALDNKLATVATDATISGDGTSGNPLTVMGGGDVTSVNGQTGVVVLNLNDLDTTVTGAELDADHIQIANNTLALVDKLDTVATDATISGDGTSGSPLSVVASGGANELDELSDVTIATPASGHLLIRDGVDFKNRSLLDSDIPDLDAAKIITGEFGSARIPSVGTSKGAAPAITPQAYIQELTVAAGTTTPAWVEKVSSGGGGGLSFFDKITLYDSSNTLIGQYDDLAATNAAVAVAGDGEYKAIVGLSYINQAGFGNSTTQTFIDIHHVTTTIYDTSTANTPAVSVFCKATGVSALENNYIRFTGYPYLLASGAVTHSAVRLAEFKGNISHQHSSLIEIGDIRILDDVDFSSSTSSTCVYIDSTLNCSGAIIDLRFRGSIDIQQYLSVNIFEDIQSPSTVKITNLVVKDNTSKPVVTNYGEINGAGDCCISNCNYNVPGGEFLKPSVGSLIKVKSSSIIANQLTSSTVGDFYNSDIEVQSISTAPSAGTLNLNYCNVIQELNTQFRAKMFNCKFEVKSALTSGFRLRDGSIIKDSMFYASGQNSGTYAFFLTDNIFYGHNIMIAQAGVTNAIKINTGMDDTNWRAGSTLYINRPIDPSSAGTSTKTFVDTNINAADLF